MRAKLLVVVAAAALVTGCQTVPRTEVTVDFKQGIVIVKSPKDITITNLVAKVLPGGAVDVQIGGYSSHNSPDVVGMTAAANAQQMRDMIAFSKELMALGAKAALPVP